MANNDINVSMGLDDSEFNRGIAKSQQTVQKFASDVNSSLESIKAKLNDMGGGVNGLTGQLEKLATAMIGAFSVKSLTDMADWANTITQTAKAVNMTTGQLTGFQMAVQQAGGTARAASLGIEMFYMKLDQARQGGLTQQVAFQRLGITLQDLKKLDDQSLMEKTIHNLAEMAPSAERNRLEVELFSKSFRGIPLQEVAALMDQNKGKFDELGPVLGSASEAYKQLQVDITEFKIAVLEIAQPLMDAFANAKPSVDDFVNALKQIIGVIAAVVAYSLAGIIAGWATGFMTFARSVVTATTALKEFSIAEAMAANATGFGAILNIIAKAAVAIAVYIGAEKLLNSTLDENAAKNGEAAKKEKENVDAKTEEARKANELYTAYAKLNAGIREQTKAFEENIQAQIQKIGLSNLTFGQSDAVKKAFEEETRIREEYRKKIAEQNVKLKEAQAASPENEKFYTQGALKKSIEELTAAQERDIKAAKEATEAAVKQSEANKAKLEISKDYVRFSREYEDILLNIDTMTSSNDERKLLAINAQTKALIEQATERRRIELGGLFDRKTNAQLEQDELLKIVKNGIENRQAYLFAGKQREIAMSREWSTGWKSAMNQYIEDATNAANASRSIFQTATKGIEDAFVNLAKTGKLSFADMTASILEEIYRIQIRMIAANIMGASNGGGFMNGLGKLMGFAQGGVVAGNAPIIVGENGPELFRPAGGGTITPNNQLGSVGTNVTYNINAVDAGSFKSMLAKDPQFLYALTLQGRKSIPGAV